PPPGQAQTFARLCWRLLTGEPMVQTRQTPGLATQVRCAPPPETPDPSPPPAWSLLSRTRPTAVTIELLMFTESAAALARFDEAARHDLLDRVAKVRDEHARTPTAIDVAGRLAQQQHAATEQVAAAAATGAARAAIAD